MFSECPVCRRRIEMVFVEEDRKVVRELILRAIFIHHEKCPANLVVEEQEAP